MATHRTKHVTHVKHVTRVTLVTRIASLCSLALWLTGCANVFRTPTPERPPFRDANLSMQAASDTIKLGKTTQADVLTTLGPATVVKFDSGFEVWVYRGHTPRPADAEKAPAEFVILFTPQGIASKMRLRPQYAKVGE